MSERSRQIDDFLADAGWSGASRVILAGDASFRRYERVTLGGKSAVLMDAPPPEEDVEPFLNMTNHLRRLNYSAPEIYADDIFSGFLLLEDLGDATYTNALAGAAEEVELYNNAVDLLIDLHRRPAKIAQPLGIAIYDQQKLMNEVLLFTEWYMPNLLGIKTDPIFRHEYEEIWRHLFGFVERAGRTLVLRDFHADNLMWLPDRPGIGACGLLDYQDAVSGPPAYDLMSLVEDARRDLKPGLEDHILDRYRNAFPDLDWPEFEAIYTILAAQRHCKVIGIFTRLGVRDEKYAYMAHVPRVWKMLERAVSRPLLMPLKTWLDKHVPMDKRKSAMHRLSV